MMWLLRCLLAVAAIGLAHASPASAPPRGLITDFCTACWNGDLDRVTALLPLQIPLEARDRLGRTPLILAAHGNPAIVKLLIARGAKIDAQENDGDTPLCLAAEHGMLENIQALLAAGADINHVNHYGRAPLALSAREGFDNIVSYLLAQHAEMTAGDPLSPPLFYAVWKDHLSTARILLNAGAKVPLPADARAANKRFSAIMQEAVIHNDRAMIDLLLDHGGDINETDSNGRSAFCSLIMRTDDAALVSHLLDRGADPNLAAEDGATPTREAFEYANDDIIRLLVQHGGNLNAQDPHGRTELMVESGFKDQEEVLKILAYHPNLDLQDQHGETALTYAADRGGVEIVRLLKRAGAAARPFHIIPKDLHELLSKSQRYALAVGAIYAQWNGDSHAALAGDEGDKEIYAKRLKDEWKVTDRASLLSTVHLLDGRPHWPEIFAGEFAGLTKATGPFNLLVRLERMEATDLWWQGRLDVAWDCCRTPNLLRWGVRAGYLSESDAWPLLRANAKRAQRTFHSWKELTVCFLARREIWARERNPEMDWCAALLLNPNDPNSPWNQVAWNTDLGK